MIACLMPAAENGPMNQSHSQTKETIVIGSSNIVAALFGRSLAFQFHESLSTNQSEDSALFYI